MLATIKLLPATVNFASPYVTCPNERLRVSYPRFCAHVFWRNRQAIAGSSEMKKEQARTETISSFFVSMAGGFF
jgi:hypothetical protein